MSADRVSRLGPSLYNIGALAEARTADMGAAEYIFSSITNPAEFRSPGVTAVMPQAIADELTDDDLLNVTAFLLSQGGKPDLASLPRLLETRRGEGSATKQSFTLSELERGKSLFFDKLGCASCHALDGTPGSELWAPSLTRIGLHDSDYLRQAILDPSEKIVSGYEQWHVSYNGRTLSGRLLHQDDTTVCLLILNPTGTFSVRWLNAEELEPFDDGNVVHRGRHSMMPSFKGAITDSELSLILGFLHTLR